MRRTPGGASASRLCAASLAFGMVLTTPALAQDEVLSRLLFNRATQNLTPFQAAQLASTAAELSGQGGPGILSQLRSSVGLDDLDVITTDTGGTAVRAVGRLP